MITMVIEELEFEFVGKGPSRSSSVAVTFFIIYNPPASQTLLVQFKRRYPIASGASNFRFFGNSEGGPIGIEVSKV